LDKPIDESRYKRLEFTAEAGVPEQLQEIDATHLKSHRAASSLLKRRCFQAYWPYRWRTEIKQLRTLGHTANAGSERVGDNQTAPNLRKPPSFTSNQLHNKTVLRPELFSRQFFRRPGPYNVGDHISVCSSGFPANDNCSKPLVLKSAFTMSAVKLWPALQAVIVLVHVAVDTCLEVKFRLFRQTWKFRVLAGVEAKLKGELCRKIK